MNVTTSETGLWTLSVHFFCRTYGETILKVESVEWLHFVSETPITTANDHPDSAAAVGLKYHPCAPLPSSDWNDKVKVRVTVAPPISGINVYLKDVDPDDPSANATGNPVDADTNGGDNRGTSSLGAAAGTTDGSGQVTIEYTVSHQPGDNHRVAATVLDASNLAMLNNNNVPANNDQVAAFCGKISNLLTVWRKLYLEFDSMRAEGTTESTKFPDINSFIAESVTVDPAAGTSEIDTFGPIFAPVEDFYEGGEVERVYAPLAGPFKVLSHTANAVFGDQIVVDQVLTSAEISALVDRIVRIRDDDQKSAQLPFYPTVSATMVSAYKDAYVDLLQQPYNPNSLVDFDLNLTDLELTTGWGWNDSNDNVASAKYWAGLCVSAYQPAEDKDGDPDVFITNTSPPLDADGFVDDDGDRTGEKINLGATPIFFNAENEFAIFVEGIREFDEAYSYSATDTVIVHELGHAGGIPNHLDLGVMTGKMSDHIRNSIPPRFTPASLARLRAVTKPVSPPGSW